MNADQVKELLKDTTPGPWAYELDSICQGYDYRDGKHVATWLATVDHENREDYIDDGYQSGSDQAGRDAALMAAAPDIAAFAIAQAAEIERLRGALERTRGELNSAMVSMDVSSTLTRQYVYAAWDALSEVVLQP